MAQTETIGTSHVGINRSDIADAIKYRWQKGRWREDMSWLKETVMNAISEPSMDDKLEQRGTQPKINARRLVVGLELGFAAGGLALTAACVPSVVESLTSTVHTTTPKPEHTAEPTAVVGIEATMTQAGYERTPNPFPTIESTATPEQVSMTAYIIGSENLDSVQQEFYAWASKKNIDSTRSEAFGFLVKGYKSASGKPDSAFPLIKNGNDTYNWPGNGEFSKLERITHEDEEGKVIAWKDGDLDLFQIFQNPKGEIERITYFLPNGTPIDVVLPDGKVGGVLASLSKDQVIESSPTPPVESWSIRSKEEYDQIVKDNNITLKDWSGRFNVIAQIAYSSSDILDGLKIDLSQVSPLILVDYDRVAESEKGVLDLVFGYIYGGNNHYLIVRYNPCKGDEFRTTPTRPRISQLGGSYGIQLVSARSVNPDIVKATIGGGETCQAYSELVPITPDAIKAGLVNKSFVHDLRPSTMVYGANRH